MDKIKNILVTGASGKIGRNLIPALINEGYNVKAIQFQTPLNYPDIEIVKGSVTDREFIKKELKDIDAICHLATTKEDYDSFLDVSVKGTFNLLDEAKECGNIKQFILAGGDAAIGIFFYPNPYPLDENTPLRAYPGCYALSKVLEETLCQQYFFQYDLPVTVLRFSWIQDEDDILSYMTFKKPNFGGPPWNEIAVTNEQLRYFEKNLDGVGCLLHSSGRPYKRHVVSVKDVVQSFILALGNPRAVGEIFNIAAPAPFSYDILAKYISNKLNLPVVDFVLDNFYDFSIDINKARAVLGYNPDYDIFKIVDDAVLFRKSGKKRSVAKYTG